MKYRYMNQVKKMNSKLLLYIFNTFIVMAALDAININSIFKKNKVLQARIFYVVISLALIYLITNFVYDFFSVLKF